jgi:cytolysin (calcineurin-like family phosphatase)
MKPTRITNTNRNKENSFGIIKFVKKIFVPIKILIFVGILIVILILSSSNAKINDDFFKNNSKAIKKANEENFSMFFTSDPQYPWYDSIYPDSLDNKQLEANSYRQISQQYASINTLAYHLDSTGYPTKGVIIDGDLTAYGHDWQFEKYKELIGQLKKISCYPGLGNHDYSNNVNQTYHNNAATRMVNYMYDFLKQNAGNLNYDFSKKSYYKFPELRTDYSGSLSYSFNIALQNNRFVHFIQLHNYPSYVSCWNSWNLSRARRDFYYIKPAFYWLENDLAISRNRGDIIIINLHDYGGSFKGDEKNKFDSLIVKYNVTAVFAGHAHKLCGYYNNIIALKPHFRCGSASYQDYLVAKFDITNNIMKVTKMASKTLDGKYTEDSTWIVYIKNNIPSIPMPVPPKQGFVTFFNQGGFVARFHLSYISNNDTISFDTGKMRLGNKIVYDTIPPYATNVRVWGEENTGLLGKKAWKTVFDTTFSSPPNNCFKLYNTTLNPKWNNNCE